MATKRKYATVDKAPPTLYELLSDAQGVRAVFSQADDREAWMVPNDIDYTTDDFASVHAALEEAWHGLRSGRGQGA